MFRTVDDWFVLSKEQLYGQTKEGIILPFDQAFFNGFRGEGGARDAQYMLRRQGESGLSLARLEMRVRKLDEFDPGHTTAGTWIIIHKKKGNFHVYGPDGNMGVLPLCQNGLQPFCSYDTLQQSAEKFAREQNLKRKNVHLATWCLHVL